MTLFSDHQSTIQTLRPLSFSSTLMPDSRTTLLHLQNKYSYSPNLSSPTRLFLLRFTWSSDITPQSTNLSTHPSLPNHTPTRSSSLTNTPYHPQSHHTLKPSLARYPTLPSALTTLTLESIIGLPIDLLPVFDHWSRTTKGKAQPQPTKKYLAEKLGPISDM